MGVRSWFVACALFGAIAPASAQTFSGIYFFGDSITDSGRYLYLPKTIGDPSTLATLGQHTTNPGPQYSILLGSYFGFPVTPSDAPGGGNNFAAGGAHVSVTPAGTNEWSTASQIAAYLASTGGVANPNALYVYYVGANDLAGGAGNIINPPNVPALTALGQQAAGQVAQLAAAGARYILVPNTITIKSQAASIASGYPGGPNENFSRLLYDQTVWGTLAAMGVKFIPADFNSIYNYVLVNPAPFGITVTNVSTPACGPTVASYNCGPANYVTPNAAQSYFYADGPLSASGGGHLASAMQKVEADYYYSLIVAPSEMSFLAEAPLKTRLGVIAAIDNQIPLSFGQTSGPFHGWVSGDVSWLKMNSGMTGFPDDPGYPLAATAGFDYAVTPDWLVGVAFSGLTTTQSFSLGGNFTQDEFAASLYTAFRHGPLWTDAIASWGTIQDTVDRQIPLGITTQSNLSTTSGSNISFAGEIGYDFINSFGTPVVASNLVTKAPAAAVAPLVVTHGPLVGLILQQVYVNAFTEVNPSGVPTALSFGTQTRNSAVTELGYQASVKYGIWEPYAKLVWDHECADLDRSVTASLTSIVAPSFSMPAVVLGRDWATATLGTRIKLSANVSGYAAVTAEVGQDNATVYGGQVGVNIAFDPTAVAR